MIGNENTIKSHHRFKTFDDYIWAFKRNLVCAYIWGVDDASKFTHPHLQVCYYEGLTCGQAYIKIFGKEHYGYSDSPPEPILSNHAASSSSNP